MSEHALPPTEQLLLCGGDARIAVEAGRPDPQLADFGSSTASVISATGFAAADRLRARIAEAGEPDALVYARELQRQRRQLQELCGIPDSAGIDMVFAASGTDLHLIAGQLAGGTQASPALVVMVDPAETGSGVDRKSTRLNSSH